MRAWVPGVGVWDAGFFDVLPGRTTDLPLRVPEPGSLRIVVDLDDAASWDSMGGSIVIPSFQGSGARSVRQLQKTAWESSFQIDLFPGPYKYWLTLAGTNLLQRNVEVAEGQVTEERIHLGATVLMTLRLSLGRALRENEVATLSLRSADGSMSIFLEPKRTGPIESIPVLLTQDVKELEVETNLGLAGTRAVTEADIVRGGVLTLDLHAKEGD